MRHCVQISFSVSPKRKKSKRKECTNCYPNEEYKEFDAVQFVKLSPQARRPSRATRGAVGYDLSAVTNYVVQPNGRTLISTGLALEIPWGMYGRIAPRSGLALRHGIDIGAGVIDPDYRDEVKVLLFNHDSEPFIIRAGDRIAQIILQALKCIAQGKEKRDDLHTGIKITCKKEFTN